jgi:hypothetical protein
MPWSALQFGSEERKIAMDAALVLGIADEHGENIDSESWLVTKPPSQPRESEQ